MFTETLREQTKELHLAAEQTEFMKQMFIGGLPLSKYLEYLMSLEKIYSVLEYEIRDSIDSDIILSVFDTRLERSALISKDIKAIARKHVLKRSTIDIINEYVKYIKSSNEVELLAHHYIRYLGDLSGGQMISKLLQRSYSFSDNQTLFYKFDLDAKQYREEYKTRLNDIVVSDESANIFINAVNNIYKITIRLLDSIMAP